jgi:hypothetical protein
MRSNDFELAFSNFIDRREYDEAKEALFTIVRASFTAGWHAAGGELPVPQKIYEVVPGKKGKPEEPAVPEKPE